MNDKYWKAISGPEMSEIICPQCHLYLVAVGHKICRTCEIHNEITEDFRQFDKERSLLQ